MKNWLDKYEQGGLVLNQKTNDNYGLRDNPSDSSVSLPPGFIGMGNNIQGRNYSPAWGGQFQNGGAIRPSFDEWYKTVPKTKNDTTSYNLRRAYDLAPQEQLDQFATNPNAHLMSAYEDPKTGIYEFMKSKNHPTLKYELDWYNSPEGKGFKATHDLDTTGEYYKYIPKKAYGGEIPKDIELQQIRRGAPSEGSYAKKTMPSAQNGQEMLFYQEGLDWKPKTISRDGSITQGYTSQADNTRVDYQPIDQTAKALGKRIQQESVQNRYRDPRQGYIGEPESSKVIIQDPNAQVVANKIKHQKMQDEYTRIKQEDAEPTSWWNKKIGAVDFTPEQQDFELQRRAINTIEDEYTPFEQKAQEAALHFATSIFPEIAIGKAISATQGLKGIRNLGSLRTGMREIEPLLAESQLIRKAEPLKNILSKITDAGIYTDFAHQQYNIPEEIEQSKVKYAENLLPRKDQKYDQKLTTIKNQNFQNGGVKSKNKKVQEFPVSKNGNALTRLNQLLNFTNYNTKQPGGWLSKYE